MSDTVAVEGLEAIGTPQTVGGSSRASGTFTTTFLASPSNGILSRRTLRPALASDEHSRTLGEAVIAEEELAASTASATGSSASALRTSGVTDQATAITEEGAGRTLLQTLSVEVDSGADAALALGCRSTGGTGSHTPVAHSLRAEVARRTGWPATAGEQAELIFTLGAPQQTQTMLASRATLPALACILEAALRTIQVAVGAIPHVPTLTLAATAPVLALPTVAEAGRTLALLFIGHGGTLALLVDLIEQEWLHTLLASIGFTRTLPALAGTLLAVEDPSHFHQEVAGWAGTSSISIVHCVGCTDSALHLVIA